jgi:hypothetical protein
MKELGCFCLSHKEYFYEENITDNVNILIMQGLCGGCLYSWQAVAYIIIEELLPYRIKEVMEMPYGYPYPYAYPSPYPTPYYPGSGAWTALWIVLFVLLLIFGGWWYFGGYYR